MRRLYSSRFRGEKSLEVALFTGDKPLMKAFAESCGLANDADLPFRPSLTLGFSVSSVEVVLCCCGDAPEPTGFLLIELGDGEEADVARCVRKGETAGMTMLVRDIWRRDLG